MKNDHIHPTVILEGNFRLDDDVTISPYVLVGYSYRKQRSKYYGNKKIENKEMDNLTYIKNGTFIGTNTIVGEGTKIGKDCVIEHNCFIGENTIIGDDNFVRYGSQIYRNVEIGNHCIIGGFLCNGVKIGDNVSFFGKCIHRHFGSDPFIPEPSPKIMDNVFIGFNSLIIGGVSIGRNAIIKVGAFITKDVADFEIIGVGEKR